MEESSNIHISGRRIWNEKVGRKRDSSEIKKKKKKGTRKLPKLSN